MSQPPKQIRITPGMKIGKNILVEGICYAGCNRYTVLKNTGIWDPKLLKGWIKIPVCTGCVRRESDCKCRPVEGETMFGNLDQQRGIIEKAGGKPRFRITGRGNGSIGGILL